MNPTSSSDERVRSALRALMPETLAARVGYAAGRAVGERREATALHVMMESLSIRTGSNGRPLLVDSETLYLISDEVMQALADVIYQYEGTIDKFTGDSLVALFGMPLAHENNAERAIRAALDLLLAAQAMKVRFLERYSVDFRVRIGIHAGTVIVGQTDGNLHVDYTVVGTTFDLTEALATAAAPDTALAGFEVYQRTHPLIAYEVHAPLLFGNPRRSERVYRPLGVRASLGSVRGIFGMDTPMIGRRTALEALRQALKDMRTTQHSRVALVTGEAGVGKSRLVREFRTMAYQASTPIYQGGCMTYARAKPLHLFTNLLRDIFFITESDPVDLQLAALQASLENLGISTPDVVSVVSSVLGLERDDQKAPQHLLDTNDEVRQKLTHTVLQQVLVSTTRQTPTVFIFEDLHWVDVASKNMLMHLLRAADDVPMLMILVARGAERETVIQPLIHATVGRHGDLLDLQLTPLPDADLAQLIDQHLTQSTDEMEALKHRIVQRADGNPFYAEEIIRMLIDHGGLVQSEGHWQVTDQGRDLAERVPGTLSELVMARFDRLPEGARYLLQKAAVLGSDFAEDLLLQVTAIEASDFDIYLDLLVARQFLTSDTRQRHAYAFRHVLIQEAIYSTLLKRDRQRFHEQAAQAIEGNGTMPSDTRAEVLAYHYTESAHPEKAFPHLIAAAENAVHRCAYETAVARYRKALSLTAPVNSESPCILLDLRIGLGRALKHTGEYGEAIKVLEEVLRDALYMRAKTDVPPILAQLVSGLNELADIRHREGAAEQAIEYLQASLSTIESQGRHTHTTLWRTVMDRMAWVRFSQGRLEEAFELASSATVSVDLDRAEDPLTLASLYNTLGGVLWQQGNLPEAILYTERSLRLYTRIDYQWGMANAYANLGILHYTQGNWSKAAEIMARAEALQERVGDLQHRAITLNNLGTLRQAMGQHEAAQRDLDASLSIFERLGDVWGAAQVHVGMARLALIQAHFANAIAHGEAALQLTDTVGAYGVEARWIIALSHADKDLTQALAQAEEALRIAQEAGLVEQEADCRRALGILRSRNGDRLEAESLLRESVDLALQSNAPYARGLALTELGRLYVRAMRAQSTEGEEWRVRALGAYHEAAEQFQRLGAIYDLQAVRAAIDTLENPTVMDVLTHGPQFQTRAKAGTAERGDLPEGGRRSATVLWFTVRPRSDTDEESFETIAVLMSALVAIVYEHQGQLIQRSDGLTAVFGAPTAFEDDADRAVQTAWHLVHYVAENTRELGAALTFSASLSQGDVVAGTIGPRLQSTFDVRGEPVQEARLLSTQVPPGEVWVTEGVRTLTERISVYKPVTFEASHPLADKAIWTLDGFKIHPQPARGISGIRARLIGRDASLQAMLNLAENLKQGIGGLVWIEGEPGIGKSRLMQEFSLQLQDSGAMILEGRCSPQKSAHAFSLITDVLVQVFDVQPHDAPDQIRAKVEQVFATWPRDTLATRPYLEALLGIWPEGVTGDRLASLEPEQLRQQTSVSLRRLFKSLSTQSPLVVLLDDLHWVDPVSAELLQFLLTIVATAPILFVCAQRRQGGDAPNDRLVRVQSLIPTQTVRFLLERLTAEEREMLLSELLPQTDLQEDLRTLILTQSEGNPYFIEEYIRMFIDQGYLQYRDNRWIMRPDLSPRQVNLPSSLETLIRSRVDALPQDLREVMQVAAVLGATIETSVLSAVTGHGEITTVLNRLASRLLMRRGTEPNQWFFHHSLIEGVVYDTLLKARRRSLHLKVAQVLAERWAGAESDHAEVLAYHLLRAEENGQALAYLMTAGERAAARFANEAAMAHFEQAADVLSTQPAASVSDDVRWRLAAGLGDVYRALGRHTDSMAALKTGLILMVTGMLAGHLRAGLYRRMGKTAQQMGDFGLANQYYEAAVRILADPDSPEMSAELARTLNGMAYLQLQQGRLEEARLTCEASMEHAQRAGDLTSLATSENILGGIHYQQRAWGEAAHHTRRAMVLREQMGYTWGVASTLSNLGLLAVLEGEWHKAQSFFERSLVLRTEIGDIEGVALIHNNLGALNRDRGYLDTAEKHFRESLNVARPFDLGFHTANSTVGLAQVLWLKGDREAAEQAVGTCLKLAVDVGAKETLVEIHRLQAEMHMEAQAWSETRAATQRALEYANAMGNRGWQASLWRLTSELELHCGNAQAAHEALDRARAALADATDTLESGRIHLQAARLAHAGGSSEEATSTMEEARKIFMRLGATLDLQRSEKAW